MDRIRAGIIDEGEVLDRPPRPQLTLSHVSFGPDGEMDFPGGAAMPARRSSPARACLQGRSARTVEIG